MKVPFAKNRFSSERGTLLVFALVVLAVGAIGMAGWVYLMGTLAQYTSAASDAAARRVNLENSRALALQYLRETVLPGNSLAAIDEAPVWGGYDLGSVKLEAATDAPLTAYTSPQGENQFSPAGFTYYQVGIQDTYFRGYSVVVSGTLGSEGASWQFEARSRCPNFGFDTLAINPAGTTQGGSGWSLDANVAAGFDNGAHIGATGGTLLNFSYLPIIFPANYSPAFTDLPSPIDVTKPVPDDGMVTYSCTGTSGVPPYQVTIYLKRKDSSEDIYIDDARLSKVVFSNTTSNPGVIVSEWDPVRVTCRVNTSFDVEFPSDGSDRRVNLAISNAGQPVNLSAGANNIKMLGLFVDTDLTIDSSGDHAIYGGIQSDRAIRFTGGGSVTFARDSNPGSMFERLGIRRAWVESYRE